MSQSISSRSRRGRLEGGERRNQTAPLNPNVLSRFIQYSQILEVSFIRRGETKWDEEESVS